MKIVLSNHVLWQKIRLKVWKKSFGHNILNIVIAKNTTLGLSNLFIFFYLDDISTKIILEFPGEDHVYLKDKKYKINEEE